MKKQLLTLILLITSIVTGCSKASSEYDTTNQTLTSYNTYLDMSMTTLTSYDESESDAFLYLDGYFGYGSNLTLMAHKDPKNIESLILNIHPNDLSNNDAKHQLQLFIDLANEIKPNHNNNDLADVDSLLNVLSTDDNPIIHEKDLLIGTDNVDDMYSLMMILSDDTMSHIGPDWAQPEIDLESNYKEDTFDKSLLNYNNYMVKASENLSSDYQDENESFLFIDGGFSNNSSLSLMVGMDDDIDSLSLYIDSNDLNHEDTKSQLQIFIDLINEINPNHNSANLANVDELIKMLTLDVNPMINESDLAVGSSTTDNIHALEVIVGEDNLLHLSPSWQTFDEESEYSEPVLDESGSVG